MHSFTHITKLSFMAILLAGLGIFSPHRVYSANPEPIKPYLKDSDFIRVGLTKNGLQDWSYNQIDVSSASDFGFWDLAQQRWVTIPARVVLRINRQPNGTFQLLWQLPGQSVMQAELLQGTQIKSLTGDRLVLPSVKKQGKMPEYRGLFELTADPLKTDKFTLVNVLTLQDYLKGVVPNELGYSFGVEAVKTQAILARNYAIHPREKASELFDICDTEFCQAYYGANTEDERVNALLEQTTDIVALYQGTPILALYSSTHGGISEDVENVFHGSTEAYPYLRGRTDYPSNIDFRSEEAARWFYTSKPHSFDENSPLFRWTRQWDGKSAQTMIQNNLRKMASDSNYRNSVKCQSNTQALTSTMNPFGLTVLQRGYSGKILNLQVQLPEQTCSIQREYTIRKVFEETSGKALPSANFVISVQKDAQNNPSQLTLNGGGFGHGVGLSQYGAGWLAKKGWQYPQIIQNYYQGVSLGTTPVTLNPEKTETIQFYGANQQAVLKIKPLYPEIKLNDYAPYQLQYNLNNNTGTQGTVNLAANNNQPISISLKNNQMNTLSLVMFRPKDNGQFSAFSQPQPVPPLQAWVELYPSK